MTLSLISVVPPPMVMAQWAVFKVTWPVTTAAPSSRIPPAIPTPTTRRRSRPDSGSGVGRELRFGPSQAADYAKPRALPMCWR
jgi:hypothetical protein